MPPSLDFTGERFIPGIPGEIVYEHWHRYVFAQSLAQGRRVLDVACGEGYGSSLLAACAAHVTGVDIDAAAVQHATTTYGKVHQNLTFVQGSAAALPLADRSIDMAVSFETIEHLPQALQAPMLEELARVLTEDGVLLISSPNRPEYSPEGAPGNPFHIHELDREELKSLLAPYFPTQVWLSQRLWFGSTLWQEAAPVAETIASKIWMQQKEGASGETVPSFTAHVPPAKYFIVLAARNAAASISGIPPLSLFSDIEEKELKRLYLQASEVLRLDQLALKRGEDLVRQAAEIKLLESAVMCRDAAATERNKEMNRMGNVLERVQAQLHYRDSFQGWLRWPLSKIRRYCRALQGGEAHE